MLPAALDPASVGVALADLQLAIRALFYLCLFLGGLAVFFVFAFAAVKPTYRRAVRMIRRYKREVVQLRLAVAAAKRQGAERALDLEATLAITERALRGKDEELKASAQRAERRDAELGRVKEIRQRTEDGLVLANARIDVLTAEAAKAGAENASLRKLMAHVQVLE